MYIFGLLLGHEPRLVDRRRRDQAEGLGDGKGDIATSTQCADDSAGETGSLLTAETPFEQVPAMHLSHGGSRHGRRARRRSRSQAPRRDRLSLWSRLMCQPEVFDPYVEASPMSYLMEVKGDAAASPPAERSQHREASAHAHRSDGHSVSDDDGDDAAEGVCDDAAIVMSASSTLGSRVVEDGTAPAAAVAAAVDDASLTRTSSLSPSSSTSSSSSDSASQDPSSPVSLVEEFPVEVQEINEENPLDVEPTALSVWATGDGGVAATLAKPRRAFRVTDTRKCRTHLSRAVALFDSPSTTNTSFATSCVPESSNSSSAKTTSQSGTTSSTTGHSTGVAGRLISRQELAVKRSQRRQQNHEAAQRLREYNAAWAELAASQRGRFNGRPPATARTRNADDAISNATWTAEEEVADSTVVVVPLTNETLELCREHTETPSYELPPDFLRRVGHLNRPVKKDVHDHGSDGAETNDEQCCSVSGDSYTSEDHNSILAIDADEAIGADTVSPVMHSTMLRRGEAADTSNSVARTATAAAMSREEHKRALEKSASPSVGLQTEAGSLQRVPRGRYALGSRGYVEHVIFAQSRQQECALFMLLTEAHRQARAAHLRLAQLYYYYVLPILAQYQVPAEVEGLVNSLLQCGTGSLRVFHADFSKTVPVNNMYDYLQGGVVPANLVQVQPVDYQFAQYRFENPWRELFREIKAFLGMQAREDGSVATLPTSLCSEAAKDAAAAAKPTTTHPSRLVLPAKGTVCMAATVLHSMELFERQRHIEMAIRDAQDWLAWYYYYLTPQLQAATSAEARTVVMQDLLRLPAGTAAGINTGVPSPLPPHPLEMEYLPLLWGRACETAKREEVLGYRRMLKLEVIAKATAAIHARGNANSKLSRDAATAGPTAVASLTTDVRNDDPNSNSRKEVLLKAEPTSPTTSFTTSAGTTGNSIAAETESGLESEIGGVLHFEEAVLPYQALASSQLPTLYADESVLSTPVRSSDTSLTVARVDGHTGRVQHGFVVAEDDDVSEEVTIAMDPYQTVKIGCFGLSLFSFFD